MAKHYLEKLSVFLKPVLSNRPKNIRFECKHFFSGAALYVEERICLSLTPVGLAVKLPEAAKHKLIKSNKAVPLQYFPGGPIKKAYVLFPDGIANDGQALYGSVKESIAYVLTLPKPNRKKKGPKTK